MNVGTLQRGKSLSISSVLWSKQKTGCCDYCHVSNVLCAYLKQTKPDMSWESQVDWCWCNLKQHFSKAIYIFLQQTSIFFYAVGKAIENWTGHKLSLWLNKKAIPWYRFSLTRNDIHSKVHSINISSVTTYNLLTNNSKLFIKLLICRSSLWFRGIFKQLCVCRGNICSGIFN